MTLFRRRPRRFAWLALLGWLAQVWAPLAHGAMPGRYIGCGDTNPAIAERLAALPVEIQDILRDTIAQQVRSHGSNTCASACSSGAAPAATAPAALPIIYLPATDSPAATHDPDACVAPQYAPTDARGPPAST